MNESSRRSAELPIGVESLLKRGETLERMLEEVSSDVELKPLLTSIVREACELLGADDGTIGIWDERRGVLRIEAAHQMPEGEVGSDVVPGQGLAGRVLIERRPVVLNRYGEISQPTQHRLKENAVIGLPIFWRDQLVGFFGLGARPPRRFGASDLESLTLFARHAAIGIEIARRFRREQSRTERLELLARVGRTISAGLELDELLKNAASAIHLLLGYPAVAIPLLDPDDAQTLVLTVTAGTAQRPLDRAVRQKIWTGIMGAAVQEGRTQLVNDVHADPRYVPIPGATNIQAELAVPIRLGRQILGVLNVESGEPFTEEDALLLEIAADHLAVAVKNARLFEQAQQLAVLEERQRLARDLHDSVTQMLASATMIAQSVTSAFRRDPEEGERRLERMIQLNRSALAEMRALLKELRPASTTGVSPFSSAELPMPGILRVRRDGLASVLPEELTQLERDGLVCRLHLLAYERLAPEREELLYRIFQEALANVVKHSGARHLTVDLSTDDGWTTLRIEDDGRGLRSPRSPSTTPAGSSQDGGMGFSTMRERAEALGGTLRVSSPPGCGTVLEIVVPALARS